MTLVVADVALVASLLYHFICVVPSVCYGMKNVVHVPVLDPTLLQQFDPLIGDRQVHSIIERDSSFLKRTCE